MFPIVLGSPSNYGALFMKKRKNVVFWNTSAFGSPNDKTTAKDPVVWFHVIGHGPGYMSATCFQTCTCNANNVNVPCTSTYVEKKNNNSNFNFNSILVLATTKIRKLKYQAQVTTWLTFSYLIRNILCNGTSIFAVGVSKWVFGSQ